VRLRPEVIAGIADGPTKEYSFEYTRCNQLLNQLSDTCVRLVTERGHHAVAFPATRHVPDDSHLSTPLPHKTVATRAGIGWIGKCALLVTDPFGSAVRLTTVLTDAPVESGPAIDESCCGDCTDCVTVCPAGAPLGFEWRPNLARDDFFDAPACRRTAQAFGAETGIGHPICGICIAACPYTQQYIAVAGEDPPPAC
jgi:epoxyqueuosine reductase QueG